MVECMDLKRVYPRVRYTPTAMDNFGAPKPLRQHMDR
jgi:hypothetical protein